MIFATESTEATKKIQFVIPAKAGIQKCFVSRDSWFVARDSWLVVRILYLAPPPVIAIPDTLGRSNLVSPIENRKLEFENHYALRFLTSSSL
jgi:hypothetical protein